MIEWFNSLTLRVGKKKNHLIPRGSASGLFIVFFQPGVWGLKLWAWNFSEAEIYSVFIIKVVLSSSDFVNHELCTTFES
jgi:hypothetical protein